MGRKSRLKERGLIHLTFRRKTMAKVTYRGVQYDTNDSKQTQSQKSELTYRGVKHSKADEVLPSYLDAGLTVA